MPAHCSTVLQPLDLTVNGEFKRLLGKYWKPQLGEMKDVKRERLLYIAGLCLDGACTILNITSGFSKAGISPYSLEAPLNSSLVRDPATQYVSERKTKRKYGPNISGKVITDGMVIPLISLPTELPPPQLPTPRPRKKKNQKASTPTSTALVSTEK
jgi:hypothetical protein